MLNANMLYEIYKCILDAVYKSNILAILHNVDDANEVISTKAKKSKAPVEDTSLLFMSISYILVQSYASF